MYVINVRNVNEALVVGTTLMSTEGILMTSRNGDTLEVPYPVSTVYQHPWERVLISRVRDANPFFHLMEALWILAGREDVKFLTEFNKRMADYSDDGKVFNAPYGYRLRNGTLNAHFDQLDYVIGLLKKDPYTRQAVCQIWDEDDLHTITVDKACNMSIVFRVRSDGRLHMIVYNRSNDMIWGTYGANAVQFSMIQEYVAAHLDRGMGSYTQVSNSFHVYTTGPGGAVWQKVKEGYIETSYDCFSSMMIMTPQDVHKIDHDILQFFNVYDEHGLSEIGNITYWESEYFRRLVIPMLSVYLWHKSFGADKALHHVEVIEADDWRMACEDWLINRVKQ